MTAAYILSPDAENDLFEIAVYTAERWGENQARQYVAKLKHCAGSLATGDAPFKDMSAVLPSLRMMRCQRHYIFYLAQTGRPARIIAILHERMDLIERIKRRL